ncbi:DUF2897 family protein [Psychromonas sp.]|nr:DUF2897 family protein [Psychromonas sp.]
MSTGWVIFIIVLVLGFIISNILLLKQSANMKIPDSVIDAVKEREAKLKEQEKLEDKQ